MGAGGVQWGVPNGSWVLLREALSWDQQQFRALPMVLSLWLCRSLLGEDIGALGGHSQIPQPGDASLPPLLHLLVLSGSCQGTSPAQAEPMTPLQVAVGA